MAVTAAGRTTRNRATVNFLFAAPVRFEAGPLPLGLSVDAESGLISGTPTELGTTAITMTAANSAGGMSRIVMVTVTDAPPPVPISGPPRPTLSSQEMRPIPIDCYTNLEEFNAGTDPLDAANTPGWPMAPPA